MDNEVVRFILVNFNNVKIIPSDQHICTITALIRGLSMTLSWSRQTGAYVKDSYIIMINNKVVYVTECVPETLRVLEAIVEGRRVVADKATKFLVSVSEMDLSDGREWIFG